MKFLTALFVSLSLVGVAFAADGSSYASAGNTRAQVFGARIYPDGYFLLNGKVMAFRDGTLREVNTDITFNNGSRILADGTLVRPDGTRTAIGSQFVTLDGELRAHRGNTLEVSHEPFVNIYPQVAIPQSSYCEPRHDPLLSEADMYKNNN